MITEDYVSFEIAKLLKEKGFQAKCTACYRSDPSHTFELVSGRINYCNPRFSKYKMIPPYNAPTFQMVMKWLREVYNLYCDIGYDFRLGWNNKIISLKETVIDHDIEMKTYLPYKTVNYPSYEEACESAIKYCLENLI